MTVKCVQCQQPIDAGARFCIHCGALQPPGAAPADVPAAAGATPGSQGDAPSGVKGWSWGAFWLNWVWAIFNKVWIGLLALIPIVGFAMIIVLGIKGREWAWKAGGWQSLEHFNQVQRRWNIAAWIVVSVSLVLGLLAGFAGDALERYRQRAQQAEVQESIFPGDAVVKEDARQPSRAQQKVAINAALQQIIQPKMLNATLKFLESKVGPPREVFETLKKELMLTYEIGGCDVKVLSLDRKEVYAFGLSAEPNCNVDISPFFYSFSNGAPMHTARLTLNDFFAAIDSPGMLVGLDLFSDCLTNCGNAVDPSIYLRWEGPRALNLLEVAFEYVLAGDASIDAAQKLEEVMRRKKGEEWIMDTRFNCNPNEYGDIAAKLFAQIRPQRIYLGHRLEMSECNH